MAEQVRNLQLCVPLGHGCWHQCVHNGLHRTSILWQEHVVQRLSAVVLHHVGYLGVTMYMCSTLATPEVAVLVGWAVFCEDFEASARVRVRQSRRKKELQQPHH